MKISEILTKYKNGTDKNRCIRRGHCYGLAYDHIFRPFDKNAKLEITEVGTQSGTSLLAWREFFPNANVSGIDYKDKVKKKDSSIEYIVSNVKDLKPKKRFDIVIDDGSHKLNDVLYTVKNFKLKVGGVMVIEDCQVPDYWYDAIKKNTKYAIEAIDLRNMYRRRDDFLIVLRNYGYK